MRGLVEDDPDPQFSYRYYDTSIATLAKLAGDWVRYTNHIVPSYRQGGAVGDPQDAAILNSLDWSSSTPGDSFAKLLAPGEAIRRRCGIGRLGTSRWVGVSNGTAFIANGYNRLPRTICGDNGRNEGGRPDDQGWADTRERTVGDGAAAARFDSECAVRRVAAAGGFHQLPSL